MACYLSTHCKSTFGFFCTNGLVYFLDSTFVPVTVLNSNIQKSFIQAPNHMIFLKTVILICCLFFVLFLSFDLWTFQMLSMCWVCFFFLSRYFGPYREREDNLTWEKLSFSRNWGFLKVAMGTSCLKMRCSSTGFADLCVHGKPVCLWRARGSSSDKAKAELSWQDPVKGRLGLCVGDHLLGPVSVNWGGGMSGQGRACDASNLFLSPAVLVLDGDFLML